MEQREFAVEAEDAGQRIDRFLAGEDTGLSRSALQNLIAEGRVLANGQPAAKNRKLKAGDTILVDAVDGGFTFAKKGDGGEMPAPAETEPEKEN